jgi:hypothetical protein
MYTVDNPPKQWSHYPKSFLNEAVPVLNSFSKHPVSTQFAFTNKFLRDSGLTQAREDQACPVIQSLAATHKSDKTEIIYEIDGSPNYDYFISISLYSGSKFIRTLMMGTRQLRSVANVSTDEEITSIRLNVRLSGFNNVEDSKVIELGATQPGLDLGE